MAKLLAGFEIEKHDGSKHAAEKVLEGKVVALYFSAHWCPPCRMFTPILKDFYEEAAPDFEVIFVSLDRSAQELKDYMKEAHGDWYHIPFNSPKIKELSGKYGVSGIPAVIVIRADGTEVTKSGRADIQGSKNPKSVVQSWKTA